MRLRPRPEELLRGSGAPPLAQRKAKGEKGSRGEGQKESRLICTGMHVHMCVRT